MNKNTKDKDILSKKINLVVSIIQLVQTFSERKTEKLKLIRVIILALLIIFVILPGKYPNNTEPDSLPPENINIVPPVQFNLSEKMDNRSVSINPDNHIENYYAPVYNNFSNTTSDNNVSENTSDDSVAVKSPNFNAIINNLKFGLRQEDVDKLMGVTPLSWPDESVSDQPDSLKNVFYVFKEEGIVIWCIFTEEDSMVGYLVTTREMTSKYDIESDERIITDKNQASANLGNGGAYSYYWRYINVLYAKKGVIIAILPYGFQADDANTLMKLVGADERMRKATELSEDEQNKIIARFKNSAYPNTFGITTERYEKNILSYINSSLWEEQFDELWEELTKGTCESL